MQTVERGRRRGRDDAAVRSGPRSVNWYGVALRAAFVLALMAAGTVIYIRASDRTAVLAVARDVAAGQVVTAKDLREVGLSHGAGLRPVPAGAQSRVVGMVADVTLKKGATLVWGSLAPAAAAVGEGEAAVGVSLKPGMYPAELRAGDKVRVVDGGSSLAGTADALVVTEARVRSVTPAAGSVEGAVTVSLIVPAASSAVVAAGAAAGRISLAVLGSV